MIASNRCRGYTLIEVLVAMFILALSLTVIFRIFSGGLLKIGIATDYSRAVMVAESVLAATGNTERLIAGETTGRLLDKYLWSRSIEPYETD
jgi:general secretion pathway protein I